MTEYVKIIRQNKTLSGLANKQIGVETVADADLGYCAWGGKDADGHITRWLAAREPGLLTTLKLSGGTTTGSVGLLQHDTNGLISGGVNSWADFTSIVTDAPGGGGSVDGSGTATYLPVWIDADTLGDSIVNQVGTSNKYLSVNGQTTSHSVDNGMVLSKLEVNSTAYFDYSVFSYVETVFVSGNVKVNSDVPLYFGTTSDARLLWSTGQTADSLILGLGPSSYAFILCRTADSAANYAYSAFTDPTIVLKGAGTTASEYMALSDGIIKTGDGTPNLLITLGGDDSDGNLIIGPAHTVVPDNSFFNLVIGYGTTLSGSSLYNLISGYDHALQGSFNLLSGYQLSIIGSYNILGGKSNVTTGSYNVSGGYNNEAGGSNNVFGGESNALDANTNYSICGGLSNLVGASYGMTFGVSNVNVYSYAICHGRYAKSLWDGGRFFTQSVLDGTTAGISQGFDSLTLGCHTTATSAVVLTSTGAGSTSPITVGEGSSLMFTVNLMGAYEDGSGIRVEQYVVLLSNRPATGIDHYAFSATKSHHVGSNDIIFTFVESGSTLQIKATPDNASPANVYAHIYGGIKLKGYTTELGS